MFINIKSKIFVILGEKWFLKCIGNYKPKGTTYNVLTVSHWTISTWTPLEGDKVEVIWIVKMAKPCYQKFLQAREKNKQNVKQVKSIRSHFTEGAVQMAN